MNEAKFCVMASTGTSPVNNGLIVSLEVDRFIVPSIGLIKLNVFPFWSCMFKSTVLTDSGSSLY